MKTPPPMPFEYHQIGLGIAASMMGRPFDHQGHTLQKGFDCAGVPYYWFGRLGVHFELPPEAFTYTRNFWASGGSQMYLARLEEHFTLIPERVVSFGDLVLFKPKTLEDAVGHAGIVLSPAQRQFFHSYHKRGVAENQWCEPFWNKHLFGFMRYRNMQQMVDRKATVPSVCKV